ncbi:ATPase [Caulobacter sp. SLTY]|uniref:SRPBCC domain-containing protein n=1 Tax=Caulobacter sp. SLTY TaxID=2683262 RepID=UPI00141285FC|nr:SRPBCC domain-containing protein [Caulobacter sp. SLTY]NBB14954.1 ATPase [Caulobacter sp. SLTY]
MTEDTADRQLTVVRVFNAPARLVFRAHAEREHIMKWFGPAGYPVTLCEIDFRVGGQWRMAMTAPDGTQNTPFGGTYLEIVPDRKIVWDNGFETPDSPRMVTSFTFDEAGGKTTLTMKTVFESKAMHDEYVGVGMEDGINSGLDQLAEVVAAMKAGT